MPTAINTGRQFPLTAVQKFTFEDIAAGLLPDIKVELPIGAVVVGGALIVETAFNTATTATADIGDAADPDRYIASPIDVKTVGYTAIVPTGLRALSTTDVVLALVEVGATATAGVGYLVIDYVVVDRSNENQG